MTHIEWVEDRYTNLVHHSTDHAGAENTYGVRTLRPRLWASADATTPQSHAALPPFTMSRRFRLVDVPADWSGQVQLRITMPARYQYTFRGRPLEPSAPPVADAAAQPFQQRVEVDGEVVVRLVQITAEGQTLTLPNAASAHSIRRSGSRQGCWEAPRRSAQSRWEERWDEGGAEDLFTVNGSHTIAPTPTEVIREVTLPTAEDSALFAVELTLNNLSIWVKQLGFSGSTQGVFDAGDDGFQLTLTLLP